MIELPEWKLQPVGRTWAECYGKPHFMAYYANGSADSNRLEDGARCMCCGRPATNSHHCPPRSVSRVFELSTPKGEFMLRPALFALCGSGTTGCHGGFHGGARFKAMWRWFGDADEEAWWDGTLLEAYGPHSPELYKHGEWEIYDQVNGRIFRIGGWN